MKNAIAVIPPRHSIRKMPNRNVVGKRLFSVRAVQRSKTLQFEYLIMQFLA